MTTRTIRFSKLDEKVLTTLLRHGCLTTEQAQALIWPTNSPEARAAWKVLDRLREAGYLAKTKSRPTVWWLSSDGRKMLASKRPGVTEEKALGPLRPHWEGVNDVHVAFVRAAIAHGDICGPTDFETEIGLGSEAGSQPMVRADGLLHYTIRDGGSATFRDAFVELHRATYGLDRLTAKLRAYASVASRKHLWASRFPGEFPPVLVVVDADRPAIMLAGALEYHCLDAERTGTDLIVYMTTLEALKNRGAREPIWHTVDGQVVDWLGEDDQVRSHSLET